MQGKEQRRVWPVILTDRVVTPGASLTREWALTDTLHAMVLWPGYAEITSPVLVVTNKKPHLHPLITAGIAISRKLDTVPADLDWGRTDYRSKQAERVEQVIWQARQQLTIARDDGLLDPLVAAAVIYRLRKAADVPAGIGSRWETAVLLYFSMVLRQARALESQMLKLMLGSARRSADSVRQDQSRARKFIDKIVNGKNLEVDDQPSRVNSKTLTEKYLQAVLPLLLPGQPVPGSFELFDTSTMTARGGRVTCDA